MVFSVVPKPFEFVVKVSGLETRSSLISSPSLAPVVEVIVLSANPMFSPGSLFHQVWSITQLYSVGFLQSKIIAKKCVF